MVRTCSASVGCARSFLPETPYPSGTGPPIQMPFLFEAAILSRDALARDLALKLREGEEHVQGQAHGVRGVELLGDGDEGDAVLVEQLDEFCEIGERARQAIDLVDDDDGRADRDAGGAVLWLQP